jgi:hypothetical protein
MLADSLNVNRPTKHQLEVKEGTIKENAEIIVIVKAKVKKKANRDNTQIQHNNLSQLYMVALLVLFILIPRLQPCYGR